jgi:capsule biosynthesis phosphatase
MIYVFDLDETICTTLGIEEMERLERYEKAAPIDIVINKMRELKSKGHTIIIHTARGMLTNNGNVAAVCFELNDITTKWLEDNRVPYDELRFGKPYADFYIDDKAITPCQLNKL